MEKGFSHKISKKRLCITAITILLVIIAITIYQLFLNTNYSKNIDIKSTNTNNSYINDKSNIGSDLVQIGNNLYYNYNYDCLKYGLYVIGQNNTGRIWWDGFSFSPECKISLTTIYKNHILNPITDSKSKYHDKNNKNTFEIDGVYLDGDIVVSEFDVNKGEYRELLKIPNPDRIKFYSTIQVVDNYFYLFSIDNGIYRYQEGDEKPMCIISKNDADLTMFDMRNFSYISNDYVYFLTLKDGKTAVCRYDIKKKSPEVVLLDGVYGSENGVDNLIANDDDGYFMVNYNKLYHIDFVTKKIEKIFETDGVIKVNFFNSKPVIAVEKSSNKNGIYVIHNFENIERLTDSEACSVYNFDDKYIYFTDSSNKVYRVLESSKKTEKIFG